MKTFSRMNMLALSLLAGSVISAHSDETEKPDISMFEKGVAAGGLAESGGVGNNPYGRLDLYQYPKAGEFDAFFTTEEAPDSLALLPPPPEEGTAEFAADVAAYEAGQALIGSARWEQATRDADLAPEALGKEFSEVFGLEISPQNAPITYNLVHRLLATLGGPGTRKAKQHYMRTRPYAYYDSRSCHTPEKEAEIRSDGSYPSGHTSYGWGTALILAEISPERQDAILKRGLELGESRVICAAHWQSDIHAGRIAGAATVARLHAVPAFIRQLEAAKHEVAQLRAKATAQ